MHTCSDSEIRNLERGGSRGLVTSSSHAALAATAEAVAADEAEEEVPDGN
jgi:hypothetical protein